MTFASLEAIVMAFVFGLGWAWFGFTYLRDRDWVSALFAALYGAATILFIVLAAWATN